MDRLYVARLGISFGEGWSYSCSFNYTINKGSFSIDIENRQYRGMDEDGRMVVAPMDINSREVGNVVEVVQAFDTDLSNEEIEDLKKKMKAGMLRLLEQYKNAYLDNYNRKVCIIKNSSVA